MRGSNSLARPLGLAVLAFAIVGASGCSWLKRDNALYAQSPESRPLEVPPDLDRPRADGAMDVQQATASATRSGTAAAASNVAFVVAGERDQVFTRVGELLAGAEGVVVNGTSQVLGTYDLAYGGSQFMVRVGAGQGGVMVSAVDPRGVAAAGEAPERLIAMLQASLAQ